MEYGVKVKEADIGDIVATRLANERDEYQNLRYIQVVDIASRAAEMKKIRGITVEVSSPDTVDLSSLPDDLVDNMLPVGDKSSLVVSPVHSQIDGSVDMTPIVSMIKTGGGTMEQEYSDRHEYGAMYPDGGTLEAAVWEDYVIYPGNAWVGEKSADGDSETVTQLLKFPAIDAERGTTIDSATIDLRLAASYGGHAQNLKVYAFTEKQVEAVLSANGTDKDRAFAFMALAESSTGVDWDLSPGTNGTWETSPNVAAAVQAAVDRPEWVRDASVWIYLQPEPFLSMLGLTEFYIDNVSYYPKLTVTHSGSVQDLDVLTTKRSAMGTAQFQDATGKYRSPDVDWDLKGAFKVGIHITDLSESNEVTIYGGVI